MWMVNGDGPRIVKARGFRRGDWPRASAGPPSFAQAGPRVRLVHLAYQAAGRELAAKTLDYSPSSLLDRAA
jgi:hypothetical protein